jgi:uncharacterized OB-fold protein
MSDWLNEVPELTQKGQIAVPYTWWVGEVGSRFLIALRDEQKILGNRCKSCNRVYVPPRKNCGRCFSDIEDWVELGNEGVVIAHTVVRYEFKPQPVAPPFAYALIKLDGADVGFLHIITENLDSLENGLRVRARFREERTGHILDIESFEMV